MTVRDTRWAAMVLAEAVSRYEMIAQPTMAIDKIERFPSTTLEGIEILGDLLAALPAETKKASVERTTISYIAGCLTAILLKHEEVQEVHGGLAEERVLCPHCGWMRERGRICQGCGKASL